MITADAAHNELCAFVRDAVNAAANEVGLGYAPEIRWPYVAEPSKPDTTKLWCRVVNSIVSEQQSSLSSEVTAPGERMFTSVGSLAIEIYVPKSIRTLGAWHLTFCRVIRDAFRKARNNNIWYRYSRINNSLLPEELFYRFNVTVEYTFSEIV